MVFVLMKWINCRVYWANVQYATLEPRGKLDPMNYCEDFWDCFWRQGKNWPIADRRVPVTSQKSLRKLSRSSFFLVSKAANNERSHTWCWTITPVNNGLMIPGSVATALEIPIRIPAKGGAMSRWFTKNPLKAKPPPPTASVRHTTATSQLVV